MCNTLCPLKTLVLVVNLYLILTIISYTDTSPFTLVVCSAFPNEFLTKNSGTVYPECFHVPKNSPVFFIHELISLCINLSHILCLEFPKYVTPLSCGKSVIKKSV